MSQTFSTLRPTQAKGIKIYYPQQVLHRLPIVFT